MVKVGMGRKGGIGRGYLRRGGVWVRELREGKGMWGSGGQGKRKERQKPIVVRGLFGFVACWVPFPIGFLSFHRTTGPSLLYFLEKC